MKILFTRRGGILGALHLFITLLIIFQLFFSALLFSLSTDIRYADDITLIIFSKLKMSTADLEIAFKKWGPRANSDKCKATKDEQDSISINNICVENVKEFVFLGSVLRDTSPDVKHRIALASSAFGRLKKKIWSRKDMPHCIKAR